MFFQLFIAMGEDVKPFMGPFPVKISMLSLRFRSLHPRFPFLRKEHWRSRIGSRYRESTSDDEECR